MASPVIFDPSASNHIGIPTSPGLVLDSAVSSVDATGGGLGSLYQDLNINANGSFNTIMTVNVTSFTNTSNALSQLGSGWQLFAVVAAQGTGICTPSCGSGIGSWAASTANIFVQLYGVKGTPLVFGNKTGISNGTGNGLNTAVTNNASLLGGQMRTSFLNPSSNAMLEFTEPNGAIGGFAGAGAGHTNGGANAAAAIDTATNNASISPFANLILLANGSTTTSSPNFSLTGGAIDSEIFSFTTSLSFETFAHGTNGFLTDGGLLPLNFTLNSGGVLGQATAVALNQEGGNNITGEYTTKDRTDQANFRVPEPFTFTIFGAGLAGLTGLMALRRRRKLARA